jgi:ribosomal silencing factor RsfS
MNGHSSIKTEAEFSDYQKEIEATDNVILCVAKAEKMIRAIGKSVLESTGTENNLPIVQSEEAKPSSA